MADGKDGMTRVRANFLATLEKNLGRKPTLTRAEIDSFWENLDEAQKEKGPMGLAVRAPSWLTNSDVYKLSRGTFTIPWEDYDRFIAEQSAKEVAKAQSKADKLAAKAAKVTKQAETAAAEATKLTFTFKK